MYGRPDSYPNGHGSGSEPIEDGAQQPVVELDGRWIAASLSGHLSPPNNKDTAISAAVDGDESASLSRQKWSGMRLVDTVVLDESGEVESWVFTAKTGQIATKKKSQDRTKIVERFKRFALANSNNKEGYVALVSNSSHEHTQPAERTVMDGEALEEAMVNSEKVPPELLGTTLQCYLRPQHGSNSFLRVRYRAAEKSVSLMKVSPLFQWTKTTTDSLVNKVASSETESQMFEDGSPDIDRLQHGTKAVLSSLVAFLEPRLRERGAAPTTICGCDADFVLDDNRELWLISLPTVTVTPGGVIGSRELRAHCTPSAASGKPGQHASDDDGMDTTEAILITTPYMPPLRASVADASHSAPANGGGTLLTIGREISLGSSSAPTLQTVDTDKQGHKAEGDGKPLLTSQVALPEIPTMLGARSTPGEHKCGSRQGKVAPIIQKTGGVYIANVHASALRGLCCWREVGSLSDWRANIVS